MGRSKEDIIHDMNSSLAALKGALSIMAKREDCSEYGEIVTLANEKIDFLDKTWKEFKERMDLKQSC